MKTPRSACVFSLLLASAFFSGWACAEDMGGAGGIHWSAIGPADHVAAGSLFSLELRVDAQDLRLAGVTLGEGPFSVKTDFSRPIALDANQTGFHLQLSVADGTAPGVYPLELEVFFDSLSSSGVADVDAIIRVGAPATDAVALQVHDEKREGKTLWKVTAPQKVPVGGRADFLFEVEIDDPFHIYSVEPNDMAVPTTFSLPAELGAVIEVKESETIPVEESWGSYKYHHEKASFTVTIQLAAGGSGPLKLPFTVGFQTCTDETCDPPSETLLTPHTWAVEGLADAPARDGSAESTGASQTPDGSIPVVGIPKNGATVAADSTGAAGVGKGRPPIGLFGFLLSAVGLALVTLVMPCTYPMIPITISIFTKGENVTRATSVRRACIYGLGIIVAYTGLAGTVQLAFGYGGHSRLEAFALNTWVNLAIGLAFLYFAFSFFGYYEIRLPGFLQKLMQKAGGMGGKVTMGSLFLMGFFFMLTSYSCGAPFVVQLFTEAVRFKGYESVSIILAFLVFSTVLAVPFVILAIVPTLLKAMPRSGGWFNTFKVVLGFFELAFAMKFLSVCDLNLELGILTRPVFLGLWIGILGLTSLYLLGLFRFPHDGSVGAVGMARMAMILVCLLLAVYLGSWFVGETLNENLSGLLPPHPYKSLADSDTASADNSTSGRPRAQMSFDELIRYHHSYPSGQKEAEATGKMHFVIVSGHNCVNCRRMEEGVLKAPAVIEAISSMVRTVLKTQRDNEAEIENRRLWLEDLGGSGVLPDYFVLDAGGRILAHHNGATSEAVFLEFLRSAGP